MPKIHIDKITHTLAGAAIAAALLPWGVIPALLAVIVAAVGKDLWGGQGQGDGEGVRFGQGGAESADQL